MDSGQRMVWRQKHWRCADGARTLGVHLVLYERFALKLNIILKLIIILSYCPHYQYIIIGLTDKEIYLFRELLVTCP